MKRPSFFQGVAVAALLGLVAAVFVAALLPFVSTVTVARLLVPGLALAYLAYLLPRSRERCGRTTVLALWSVMAVLTWLFVPSFAVYLLIHTGALWLIRSLYFYAGVIPSLLDMALSGFAVVFTFSTLHRTGSVFLATWGFFLIQALFVAIPASIRQRPTATSPRESDQFDRSRRQAEAALKQLITH